MVLAAAGADHEELRALADPLFADMKGGALSEPPPSKYLGGDWRAASNNPVSERGAVAIIRLGDHHGVVMMSHGLRGSPPPAPLRCAEGKAGQLVGSVFQLTHVAMAFEIEGGWRNEKDALAVSVLQVGDAA